jgi:DNA-binding winged helix-turn-helix (wHTH) protein
MKHIYEFVDFRADPAEKLLLHEGQPVALTPKVFETLLILLESEGRLIDKEDFISRLWPGVFVEDVARPRIFPCGGFWPKEEWEPR